MAFFRNTKSKQLYFSPIFFRRGDSDCHGKLCIVPPLAHKLSSLLPFFALITVSLTIINAGSIFAPNSPVLLLNSENINIFIMTASLFPGGCATWIAILCQLQSIKNGLYYENKQGAIELDRSRSISIYITYAFVLINIAVGYIWLHKNPRYDFEEMPFFPLVIGLISLMSLPIWSRIFWLIRKWNRPAILWTAASHF